MSQVTSLPQQGGLGVLTPADILRIVRKRLWLILACFVVIGLGGTAGLVAWYIYFPSYTAEGVLTVEPGQGQASPLTGGYVENAVPFQLFDQYVQGQVMAIRNDRVLNAALDSLKDEQTMYSGAAASYRLGKDLDVNYLVGTQNIVVRLSGTNKEQIQAIVRQVLDLYTKQLGADRAQVDADRQSELRTEQKDLQTRLDSLGRRLATYREDSNIISSDERFNEQLARLTAVTQQLTQAQVALAEASAAWKQFQELRAQAEESKDLSPVLNAFPELTEALRRDPTIAALSEQASRAGQELKGLQQRFGPKHEAIRRMDTATQAAQNDLEAKQTLVLGQLFQQQAAVLKSKYDTAKAAVAELESRVGEARTAAVSVAKLTTEYRAREEEFRGVQTLLTTVNEGIAKMRISSAISRPNVRISQVPSIPLEPSQPKLIFYIPAVIIFSLLTGLGLALAIEIMDTRLRTPMDVIRQVGVPLLGSVPDLSEDERLSLDTKVAQVSQTMPQSLMAESFRQFRTNLLFASDKPIRSVLITSPNPGDGKSVVAANLAITMARSGNRVLLIDANFRRPTLGRGFDVPETVGLSNVLVGLCTAADAIQATSVENLDLLVSGPVPPSPAELLGSAGMRQLVKEQSHAYDHVIIDGAPALVVADNHLLAELVDGVVLIYRAGENTRGLAQRAARQVLGQRARLLGAVLNRVRATKGGYFRESYQAYYDYSATARLVPVRPVGAGTGPGSPSTPSGGAGGSPKA